MSEQDLLAAANGAVVVGVDDTEGARTALIYAMQEATRRGVGLLAVSVFPSPSAWAPEVASVLTEEQVSEDLRGASRRMVSEVVSEQRELGVQSPHITMGIRSGSAVDVLCRLSRNAAVLVVGHRGRGALTSRIMGSMGLGVVMNAHCPVIVVRPSHLVHAQPAEAPTPVEG